MTNEHHIPYNELLSKLYFRNCKSQLKLYAGNASSNPHGLGEGGGGGGGGRDKIMIADIS